MDICEYHKLDMNRLCSNIKENSNIVMDYKKILQNGPASPHCNAESPFRNSLVWEEFFGSSLELAPSLMNIYDTKVAGDDGIKNNELNQHANSVSYSGISSELNKNVLNPSVPQAEVRSTYVIGNGTMGRTEFEKQEDYLSPKNDNKKRPLSLSSMSSSSTSSLPRFQHKRLNVTDSDSSRSIPDSTDSNTHLDNTCTYGENHHFEFRNHDDSKRREHTDVNHNKSFNDNDEKTPVPSPEAQTRTFNLNQNTPKPSKTNNQHSKLDDIPRRESHKKVRHSVRNKSSSLPTSHVIRPGQLGSHHYQTHTERVVAELIETEKNYVGHLHEIIEGYLEPITADSKVKLAEAERVCLFSNIVEIYTFSKGFYMELEKCEGDPLAIAQCFLSNRDGFEIYTEYCTNYPSAVEILTKTMKDPELCAVFKQRQIYLGHGLPLGAYLLKPVQRVLKYHLLFQNILKNYGKTKEGYKLLEQALKLMTGMAYHINEMKRKHEHAVRIQEIQSQLEDYEGEDLTRLGELVLECFFRVHGAKASRQVFLFEKGLLICKKRENGMFVSKTFIQCSNLMLVESIPKEPLSFQVIPFNNSRMQYTLQARNLEQKRKWCLEIKRLMLESYQVKIPEKVKNLVMEIGMNKDEEDYLVMDNTDSGKKLHLAAPEYLEKRRLKKAGNTSTDNLLKPLNMFGKKSGGRSPSPSRLPFFKEGPPTKRKLSPNAQSDTMLTSQANIVDEVEKKGQVVTDLESDDSGGQSQRARSFRMAVNNDPIGAVDIKLDGSRKRHNSVDSVSMYSSSDPSNSSVFSDGFSNPNQSSREGLLFEEISDDEMMYADEDGISESIYSSMPVLRDSDRMERQSMPAHSPEQSEIMEMSHSLDNILPSNDNVINTSSDGRGLNLRHGSQEHRPVSSSNSNTITKTSPGLHSEKKRTSFLSCDNILDLNSSLIGSQAKLTDWNSVEKFTKGSLTDVSEGNVDPWVQQSHVKRKTQSVHLNDTDILNDSFSYSQQLSKASKQYQDWLVYANRNSLPVNFNPDDVTKWFTSPTKGVTSPAVDSTPSFKRRSLIDKPKSCNRDLVTGTKTSKKTLHRSHSTPNASMSSMYLNWRKYHHHSFTDDPEEIVAEMEHYIKNTSSSSNISKFPIISQSYNNEHDDSKDVWVSRTSVHSSSSRGSLPSDGSDNADNFSESLRKSSNSSLSGSSKSSRPASLYFYDNMSEDTAYISPDNDDDLVQLAGNYGPKMRFTLAENKQTAKVNKKPDLPTILLESGPGSHLIGSRMAENVYGPSTGTNKNSLSPERQMNKDEMLAHNRNSQTPVVTRSSNIELSQFTTGNIVQRNNSSISDEYHLVSPGDSTVRKSKHVSNNSDKHQKRPTDPPAFSKDGQCLSTNDLNKIAKKCSAVGTPNFTNSIYSQQKPIMIPFIDIHPSDRQQNEEKHIKYNQESTYLSSVTPEILNTDIPTKKADVVAAVTVPSDSAALTSRQPSMETSLSKLKYIDQKLEYGDSNTTHSSDSFTQFSDSQCIASTSIRTASGTSVCKPCFIKATNSPPIDFGRRKVELSTDSVICSPTREQLLPECNHEQTSVYSTSPSDNLQSTIVSVLPAMCHINRLNSTTSEQIYVTSNLLSSYSKILISNQQTDSCRLQSGLKSVQCREAPVMSSVAICNLPSSDSELLPSESSCTSISENGITSQSEIINSLIESRLPLHSVSEPDSSKDNKTTTGAQSSQKGSPSISFVSVSPVFPTISQKIDRKTTLDEAYSDQRCVPKLEGNDTRANYYSQNSTYPNSDIVQPVLATSMSSSNCNCGNALCECFKYNNSVISRQTSASTTCTEKSAVKSETMMADCSECVSPVISGTRMSSVNDHSGGAEALNPHTSEPSKDISVSVSTVTPKTSIPSGSESSVSVHFLMPQNRTDIESDSFLSSNDIRETRTYLASESSLSDNALMKNSMCINSEMLERLPSMSERTLPVNSVSKKLSDEGHSRIASLREAFFNSPITTDCQPSQTNTHKYSQTLPTSPKEHFLSLSPDSFNSNTAGNFTQYTATKCLSPTENKTTNKWNSFENEDDGVTPCNKWNASENEDKDITPSNTQNASENEDKVFTSCSDVFIPSPSEVKNEAVGNSNLRRSYSESSIASVDSLFERRFSKVFDDDNSFVCDIDIDNEPDPLQTLEKNGPKKSIKSLVRYIEEKNRPKALKKHEVKRHPPGPIIRQKMISLQKSQSRSSSRASSEDRELLSPSPLFNFKQYHEQNFENHATPFHTHAKNSPRNRHSASPTLMRSATSMVQLDQLGHPRQDVGKPDVRNVVIIRGWVQKVISKFQKS